MSHFVASLITDPAKIIEFPLTIFKMCVTFAQDILKLMV